MQDNDDLAKTLRAVQMVKAWHDGDMHGDKRQHYLSHRTRHDDGEHNSEQRVRDIDISYIFVAVLLPNLRKVSFYNATEFLDHSSTIELLSVLILTKGGYLSFKALQYYDVGNRSALWLIQKVAARVSI